MSVSAFRNSSSKNTRWVITSLAAAMSILNVASRRSFAARRELGAVLRMGTTVLAIDDEGGSVRIGTDAGDILAEQVVLAAGSWASSLVGSPFDRVLSTCRQVMHWFPVDQERLADWQNGPVFIWTHGPLPSDMVYGFPTLPGHRTVKTAGEQYNDTAHPDHVERQIGADESSSMYATQRCGAVAGACSGGGESDDLPLHGDAGFAFSYRQAPA